MVQCGPAGLITKRQCSAAQNGAVRCCALARLAAKWACHTAGSEDQVRVSLAMALTLLQVADRVKESFYIFWAEPSREPLGWEEMWAGCKLVIRALQTASDSSVSSSILCTSRMLS